MLLRMARDRRILHMPMEWMNDNAIGISGHFLIWYINHIITVTTVFQLHTADSDTNKMGHPTHYHHNVRVYLYNSFPECWIGCRKNIWVPHTIKWFNPPPPDLCLCVWGGPWRRTRTLLYISPSSKFGGCLLVSYSRLSTVTKLRVVIFNTCFRFTNSVSSHVNACDSVYYVTLNWFHKCDLFRDTLYMALINITGFGRKWSWPTSGKIPAIFWRDWKE
jgi:hypothetical protein